jgi:hypothetical protein
MCEIQLILIFNVRFLKIFSIFKTFIKSRYSVRILAFITKIVGELCLYALLSSS